MRAQKIINLSTPATLQTINKALTKLSSKTKLPQSYIIECFLLKELSHYDKTCREEYSNWKDTCKELLKERND